MEKLKNFYTATSDKDVLTLGMLKKIMNELPEDQLEFECVVVDQIGTELRGIPVSNVILDEEGKQLTIFNFMLRNKLKAETHTTTTPLQAEGVNGNTPE